MGVIRALASALDCLAGVIIGVAALPADILRADFSRARNVLKSGCTPTKQAESRLRSFGGRLEANIANAGPDGWLEWTLDFRNMLVHRGRRFEIGQLLPRLPVLYRPSGEPIMQRVIQLPRDPGRSEVEVFLDSPWSQVLTEDAKQTLEGLKNSTMALIERTAEDLLDLWTWRRANPRILEQPRTQ
ncbi:MAG: hypothetical protein KIT09_35955 [Bryobacteraceae bacterium]|nr:hypothetical protein [Bryobacteraceae bacterium]